MSEILRSYSIIHVAKETIQMNFFDRMFVQERQILPVNQDLSSAKFQLLSCNLSLAMIWQTTYTCKLPKLCSATLIG